MAVEGQTVEPLIPPTRLFFCDFVLIQHFLSHLPLIQMLLSFFWSAQVSYVFLLLLPLLSFFRFQVLAHAVQDAVHLLVVASLDVTLVLDVVVVTLVLVVVVVTLVLAAVVLVAVVNVTLLAGDEILFLHAPALTPTGALAVVALFFTLLLGFRAPFLRSVASLVIASWQTGLFSASMCSRMLGETSTFSSAFSTAPFLVSITVSSFGFLSPVDVVDTNDVWFPQSLLMLYCLIRS